MLVSSPIVTMTLRMILVVFPNANHPSAVRTKSHGAILEDEMIVHSAVLLR